jgi:hypothetical protein
LYVYLGADNDEGGSAKWNSVQVYYGHAPPTMAPVIAPTPQPKQTYSTNFDGYSFLPFTTYSYLSWTLNSYQTPSTNTGPSADHTTGTGYYAYVEASSPNYPNVGPFILNLEVSSGVQHANFYYNMYGVDMGYLLFQTSSDSGSTWTTRWAKSGNQGSSWQYAYVSVSETTTTNARFYAVTGSGWASDIAIDDVYVFCGDDDDDDDDNENGASSEADAAGLSFGVIGAFLLLALTCYIFYLETSPKVREKRSIAAAAARAKGEEDSTVIGSNIASSFIQPQELDGAIIGEEGTGTTYLSNNI